MRLLSVAVLVLSYNRTSLLAKVKRVTYAKNQHSFLCCLPDGCNRCKKMFAQLTVLESENSGKMEEPCPDKFAFASGAEQ